MSRLIFLNLAIDQLWDPDKNLASLFPARIPESEHLIRINENLGIFLSSADDVVLGYKETAGFRQFLQERNLDVAPLIEISKHPFDQDQWTEEVIEKLKARGPFTDLIAASMSPLEESLLNHPSHFIRSKPRMKAQTLADLNRKTFLIQLSEQGLVEIPETELIWQKDLVNAQIPPFSDKRIFKHDFGSGGAANFSVTGSKDPVLHLLQRRLDPKVQVQWLMQKQLSPKVEGSIFGWAPDSEPAQVANIQYSTQGLSYRHDFAAQEDLKQKAQSLYKKVETHLLKIGYTGPIGLDFLQDADSNEILIVDLNLRLTKTHVISKALQKSGLSFENTVSLRHRWKSQEMLNFQDWWNRCQSDFQLNAKGESQDGNFIIPYSVAGIEAPGGLKEISVFISKTPDFEKAVLNKWGLT